MVRVSQIMAKLQALNHWADSGLFNVRERSALDFAEATTRSGREVDDGLMNHLKIHFRDDEIVELTGLIAFQNMSSKFNNALGVPPQGFCQVPTTLQQKDPIKPPGVDADRAQQILSIRADIVVLAIAAGLCRGDGFFVEI